MWAGIGSGLADGPATVAKFNLPRYLTVASNGIVYVVDWGNDRIRKVMPDGSVSTLAGGGGNANVSYADGQGTNAAFSRPYGIVIDPTESFLFVCDYGNHKIRKITTGGLVSTVAGSATAGYSDGQGTFASFSGPSGLDMSISGDIFVADYGNHRIKLIQLVTFRLSAGQAPRRLPTVT